MGGYSSYVSYISWESVEWIVWFRIGATVGLFEDIDESSCSLNAENICYLSSKIT
jgi:hypothetical protein